MYNILLESVKNAVADWKKYHKNIKSWDRNLVILKLLWYIINQKEEAVTVKENKFEKTIVFNGSEYALTFYDDFEGLELPDGILVDYVKVYKKINN